MVLPAAGPERAPRSTQIEPELPAGLRSAPPATDAQVDAEPAPVLPRPEPERAPQTAALVQRQALEPRLV